MTFKISAFYLLCENVALKMQKMIATFAFLASHQLQRIDLPKHHSVKAPQPFFGNFLVQCVFQCLCYDSEINLLLYLAGYFQRYSKEIKFDWALRFLLYNGLKLIVLRDPSTIQVVFFSRCFVSFLIILQTLSSFMYYFQCRF